MNETDPAVQKYQTRLERLESLRDLLGEEQYRIALARLEVQFRDQVQTRQQPRQSEAGQPDERLSILLQSRQVNVTSDASGNIIITGDNNLVLTLPPDQAPELLLRLYYRSLAAECSRLPLGLIHEEFARPGVDSSVTLPSVYTDLDVVSAPPEEKGKSKEDRRWMGLRLERGEGGERTALLQAISQPDAPNLALLGLPGSGKTTFVNYLTARLAGGETQGLPETLQHCLPGCCRCCNPSGTIIPSSVASSKGRARWLWPVWKMRPL